MVSINLIHVFLSVLSEDGNRDRHYHSIRLNENPKSHVTQTQGRAAKPVCPSLLPLFQVQFRVLNLLAGERAQARLLLARHFVT